MTQCMSVVNVVLACLFHWESSMRYFYSYSETTSSVPEHGWGKSKYVYYSVVFYVFLSCISGSITFRIRFGVFAGTVHQ